MRLELCPPAVQTYLEWGEGIFRGNDYGMIEFFLFYYCPSFIC